MMTITLTQNYAFQDFTATLGDNTLNFKFKWLTRYGYYSVDILDIDNNPITFGRALHPGVNLLSGLNINLGRIVLEGEQPTIDNLGLDNKLRWYPNE